MQFGLKNRLRRISLLPILIVFSITSYYAYESFINYKAAQILQDKLSENKQLNELVGNISRERGMTVMYLGNSSPNTLKSLVQQRKIVDNKFKSYVSNTQNNTQFCDVATGFNYIGTSGNTTSDCHIGMYWRAATVTTGDDTFNVEMGTTSNSIFWYIS